MTGSSDHAAPILIHATCIAWAGRGVLLRGPSGSGKSDLALRSIEQGAVLVADDQVVLVRRGDQVWAEPPPALAGLIEVRGIGIVERDWVGAIRVLALFDLTAGMSIARLPQIETIPVAGAALPYFRIAPFEASAPAKLRVGLDLAARRADHAREDHHQSDRHHIRAG